MLLEEMSAEYGDLLLHTEIRWLSRGQVVLRFLSLLGEIGLDWIHFIIIVQSTSTETTR